MLTRSVSLLVLAAVVAAPAPAFAQSALSAGRFVLAAGAVQLVRGTTTIVARTGLEVRAGDIVRTAPSSSAQLWLKDGGMIAVRERSEFRLDSYNYNKDGNAANQTQVATLVKGGARILTGAIAKSNPGGIQVNTRVATIGIRGTGFDLIDCIDQCIENDGSIAKEGLYGAVYEGALIISNDRGRDDLLKSEIFYVATRESAVLRLPTQPSFLAEPPVVDGTGKSTEGTEPPNVAADVPSDDSGLALGLQTDSLQNVRMAPPEQADALTTPKEIYNKNGLGDNVGLAAGNNAYLALQSAEYNSDTGQRNISNFLGTNTAFTGPLTVAFANGQEVSIAFPRIPSFPGYVINGYTASEQEGGSDAGVIAWGRWADGSLLIGNWSYTGATPKEITLTQAQGFHWIVGDLAQTLPASGIYEFNLIAATTPTEARADAQLGWFVTGGTLNANLLTSSVDGHLTLFLSRQEGYGYFDLQFASTSPVVAGGPINMNIAVDRQNGSANICTLTCTGLGTMAFYGNDPAQPASHAGLTYDFNTGNYVVQGAAVFGR